MKFKKYLISLLLLLVLSVILAGCSSDSNNSSNNSSDSSNANNDEKIVLKFAGGLPETHILYKGVEKVFMDRVTELTNGQVQFEHYPSEQLGKSADLLGLAADGVADIAFFSPGYNPSVMPISSALYAMPGLYENSVDISSVVHNLTKQSPILESDFLRNGVRPLMTVFTPSYGIFTTDKVVKVPSDLKGLKLKAAGGVTNEALSYLGANPVTIPVGDLFSSLERKVVNGMHSYYQDVVVFNLEDLLNHATVDISFGGSGPGYAISEKKFQSLPEHVQNAILQAADEVVESGAKTYDEVTREAREQAKDRVVITELTEEEHAQWQEAFKEFNEIWVSKQSDDFKKAYEMLTKALEEQKNK